MDSRGGLRMHTSEVVDVNRKERFGALRGKDLAGGSSAGTSQERESLQDLRWPRRRDRDEPKVCKRFLLWTNSRPD